MPDGRFVRDNQKTKKGGARSGAVLHPDAMRTGRIQGEGWLVIVCSHILNIGYGRGGGG